MRIVTIAGRTYAVCDRAAKTDTPGMWRSRSYFAIGGQLYQTDMYHINGKNGAQYTQALETFRVDIQGMYALMKQWSEARAYSVYRGINHECHKPVESDMCYEWCDFRDWDGYLDPEEETEFRTIVSYFRKWHKGN